MSAILPFMGAVQAFQVIMGSLPPFVPLYIGSIFLLSAGVNLLAFAVERWFS